MNKDKFKKVIFTMIGSSIAMLIALNIVRNIEEKSNALSENEIIAQLQVGLEKGAKDLNSKTPFMVDEDTRLDLVTVTGELTSNYFYTFPHYSSSGIDPYSASTQLKKIILSKICTDQSIIETLSHGGLLKYTYSGNDNIEIIHINITKLDCNQ